jgi:hypothetical protein
MAVFIAFKATNRTVFPAASWELHFLRDPGSASHNRDGTRLATSKCLAKGEQTVIGRGIESLAAAGRPPWVSKKAILPALLAAFSLVATACSSSGATPAAAPAPPTVAPAANGVVTAGVPIGTMPTLREGWSPPAKITLVDPPPGMFKSVSDTPQPGAKVRVFFLGMQW